MASHSDEWGEAAWTVLLRRVLPRVLCSPSSSTAEGAPSSLSPSGTSKEASSAATVSSFVLRAGEAFTGLCDRLAAVQPAVHGELLGLISSTCLQWLSQVSHACTGVVKV